MENKSLKFEIKYICGICGKEVNRPIKLNEKIMCGFSYCPNCKVVYYTGEDI